MNRHTRRLNDLFNLARDHKPEKLASVVASIYVGNSLVSYGFNSRKTHPLQYRFSKSEDSVCIHAEIDAIANALRRVSVEDLRGASLYVARAKSLGPKKPRDVVALAKPCEGCSKAIKVFGIGRVFYTE